MEVEAPSGPEETGSRRPLRSKSQRLKDLVAFPLRAVSLFYDDRWGLSSLQTERYDYVAREIAGRTLDIGCGRHDRFIREWLGGQGVGIDVFPYDGLSPDQIVEDPTHLPFPDRSFDRVTFIANLNHVPEPMRDAELAEAFRCLRPGGKVVVTMGNPLAELAVHRLVHFLDRFAGTNLDVDSERGMEAEEAYYLLDREIVERLRRAGFVDIRKKSFITQWGLKHLLTGMRPAE